MTKDELSSSSNLTLENDLREVELTAEVEVGVGRGGFITPGDLKEDCYKGSMLKNILFDQPKRVI